MPIDLSSRSISYFRPISSSPAITYSAAELEFDPGADAKPILFRRRKSISIWSKPIVAVATKRTLLSANKSESTGVILRTKRTSASLTIPGVISLPPTILTSPMEEKHSAANGIFASAIIFI